MCSLQHIIFLSTLLLTDLEMEDSQKGFVLYYFVEGDRVESAPGRIERESKDINRTYEITRRRYY